MIRRDFGEQNETARWSRRRRGPALASAALSLLLAAWASAAPDGPLWPDREEIEHFLKKAKVTARKKVGVGVTNPEKVTGTTLDEDDGTFPDVTGWRDQVSVMWLFDDLIANVDRHLNNGMVSPAHRLMLIDNSRWFRDMAELRNGPACGGLRREPVRKG